MAYLGSFHLRKNNYIPVKVMNFDGKIVHEYFWSVLSHIYSEMVEISF